MVVGVLCRCGGGFSMVCGDMWFVVVICDGSFWCLLELELVIVLLTMN